MNILRLMNLVCFCIVASVVFGQSSNAIKSDKSVTTKLGEVILYFEGAQLNYQSQANLKKGNNEIKITGLPFMIDKNSIKIQVPNYATVNSYSFANDYLAPLNETKELKMLKDSLQLCHNKLNEVVDKITVNANVLQLMKVNTAGNNDGNINLVDLIKYSDFYKNKSGELMSETRALEKKKTDLYNTINRLQRQINTDQYSVTQQEGVLTVHIMSNENSSTPIFVNMYTTSAGWSPYYDVNIESINSPIHVKYKASVHQNTGIDWSDVNLVLTTMQPGVGKIAPELQTKFIDYQKPENSTGIIPPNGRPVDIVNFTAEARQRSIVPQGAIAKQVMTTTDMNFTTENESFAPQLQSNHHATNNMVILNKNQQSDKSNQQSNGITHTFAIDNAYTIRGNGSMQYIDLTSRTISADYAYMIVPQLSTEAYLVAEISDWSNMGLTSGVANINFGGNYVGETNINAQSIEKKLTLTLATDSRISVKWEKMQDFTSQKGLGNNTTQQSLLYRATVKNNQPNSANIILKAQYPISSQKDIVVELSKSTTAGNTINQTTGIIQWTFDLTSGGSKTIDLGYSVKYPKDTEVVW